MIHEVRESGDAKCVAIEAVPGKIGCNAQMLSNWIRKSPVPAAPNTPATVACIKELELEV